MIWDDVKPWAEPPQEITAVLERVGGRNPFRKPNFRLVLAQGVFKLRGGLWHKWRDGATLQARGGMFVNEDGVRVQQSAEKPISVTAEMRWVKPIRRKTCKAGSSKSGIRHTSLALRKSGEARRCWAPISAS
jgi:hypothetical protein